MKVEAVLFDLDGTLTNTLEDIAFAMNRALRLHGLPEFQVEEYKYLVGDGVVTLSERACRDQAAMAPVVRETYQSYYHDHSLDRSRPYDGIPELLKALTERGLKLTVFSNKPHDDTRQVVQHFFPDVPFAVVRGAQKGVPVKPDPAGALAVAQELGVAPEKFLYLGDTNTDMRCAVNAGMIPVGVCWGFRDAQELRQCGAQVLIEHPLQLLDEIDL